MIRSVVLACICAVTFAVGCRSPAAGRSEISTADAAAARAPIPTAKLVDGSYAVVSESAAPPLHPAPSGQRTILYDPRNADPSSDGARQYVTIDETDVVPFVLSRAPEPVAERDGRIRLNVTLAPKHIATLEDFTRRHLGGRTAMVLDQEVVSLHKIRAIISDGRLQITRCGDRACDKILAKLQEQDSSP